MHNGRNLTPGGWNFSFDLATGPTSDVTLPTPLVPAAGNYWIGVITGAGGNVAGFL